MRIDERHGHLGDYIKQSGQNTFGIAAFQRDYCWTKEDVERYLQSITDGIPIGGFLLWTLSPDQEGGLLSKGRMGPVVHNAATRTMILDGQNRLSSLLWAARLDDAVPEPGHPYSKEERETWLSGEILVADYKEQRMFFAPKEDAFGPYRYPLGELLGHSIMGLFNSRVMFERFANSGLHDDALNWMLDTVPHHFRAKKTVVTEIFDATPEQAYDIFLRICKTGQPITDTDLEKARAWIAPASGRQT